ncbi:putative membrane protein [Sediminihabitans luteus]|uniref:Putative membrane protein n=1 Tax=Sediminihabitans luteus TaxID=1138585 RepID=A0A2M9CBV0_9CELL|nr:DUF2254 domain-containing protein [Sediminihabitans luteus]PJJ68562.1 putative membrane protein [Sediminihabitans luteus]GII99897.1 hypothetical protein Slu03_22750 [Sediminihabitans luteus]
MVTAWVTRARESFWLAPTLLGVAAIVLALGLVALDRTLQQDGVTDLPLLGTLSASGSRAVLTAIGGSMLTVAATSFSITISVMATTSSAYGPRLVRNFMADRSNQTVLAVFTSTFLYSLVVLRSVRSEVDGSDAFVPSVAVHVAVLLAVVDVAFLVYFIHHIAQSVQVTTLQQKVRDELVAVVDQVFPAEPSDDRRDVVPAVRADAPVVTADAAGYVQYVDLDGLVRRACGAGVVVELLAAPGDHVIPGEPLARVGAPDRGPLPDGARDDGPALVTRLDPDLVAGLRGDVMLGSSRTPYQDVRFAVRQLTEMAVRALSPGTNDPYTPVSAFDALASGLVPVVVRAPAARGRADGAGDVRVVVPWPTAESLVADVLVAVRAYALEAPVALDGAVRLVERLERAATRPAVRAALADEVARLRADLDDVRTTEAAGVGGGGVGAAGREGAGADVRGRLDEVLRALRG